MDSWRHHNLTEARLTKVNALAGAALQSDRGIRPSPELQVEE